MNHTEQALEMVATAEQSSCVGASIQEPLIVEPVVKDLFTGWVVGVQSESGAVAVFPFQPVFETEAEAEAEAAARRERKPYIRYVAVCATPPAAEGTP